MTPFFIYFYWAFNDYLQLSFLFGFARRIFSLTCSSRW